MNMTCASGSPENLARPHTQSRQVIVDLQFAPRAAVSCSVLSPVPTPVPAPGTHGAAGEDELAQEERRPAALLGDVRGRGGALSIVTASPESLRTA